MSISIVNVVVPAAGDGPIASVANLVGAKTVELSGVFRGRYVLLGSQNDVNFVPVAFFDSDGKESIKVTLELALSQVRVRSEAVGAANVTMNVSGVLQVGGNQLTTIASIPAGSSGQQAVVDLDVVFPPTGVEQDICVLCDGSFQGLLFVEGSLDGVNFNPVGSGFRADRQPPSLLGSNPPLEFSPLTTKALVRYLRVTLTGVAATQVVVTFGGSNPAAGGGSPTVPIPLLIATVGGEGPPSVTYQGAGTVVGTTIGVATVVAGDGNTISGLGNDNSVVVGSGISLGNFVGNVVASGASIAVRDFNNYLTVLGQLISVGSNSTGSVVLGNSVAVGAGNLAAVVINGTLGDNAGNSILIGQSTIGSVGGTRAAANFLAGTGSTITDGSVNVIVIGNACTAGIGTFVAASDGAVIIGVGSNVGSNSSAAVVAGYNASIGASSPFAVAVHGTIGDAAQNSIVLGQSTIGSVGGTRAAANFIAGTGSSIADGSVNVTVIGNANSVVSSDASVLIGTSASIATACSFAIALGSGTTIAASSTAAVSILGTTGTLSPFSTNIHGTLGDNAEDSILIGRSNLGTTGGARAADNILIGTGSTIGDGSVYATLIGGNSTLTSSDYAIIVGYGASIATTSPNAMALGSSAAVGSSSQSAVAVLGTTGNSSPFSLNVNGTMGTGNPDVVCILGQIGDGCNASVAIGIGNTMGPNSIFSAIVGQNNHIGDLSHSATGYIFGDGCAISNGVLQGLALGQACAVTGTCGIAIGSFAMAGANQCIIGNNGTHPVDAAIHLFAVAGGTSVSPLTSFQAIDNPASGSTGITLVFNNGATTTSKVVKATTLAGMNPASLVLYVDP
jgi:hypothetical protein